MQERFEIVMPVFDRPDRVIRTLNEFFRHTVRSPDLPYDFRFTIVNDGCWKFPSIGDWDFLRTSADNYIDLVQRKGIARALNAGVTSARAQWVFVLHSDILVHDNWIEEVIAERDRLIKKYDNLAMIGFEIRGEDGAVQPSAGLLNDTGETIKNNIEPDFPELVDYVHTKACFINRMAYFQFGGPVRSLKEFFISQDLGMRFKTDGFKVAFSRATSFVHQSELGIPKKYYPKDLKRYKRVWGGPVWKV